MDAPAPPRLSKRPCLYSGPYYCLYGQHLLRLEDNGILLHRFVPGPRIKRPQHPPCPRPCLFEVKHSHLGRGVIMASHEWTFEDIINVEVRLRRDITEDKAPH